MLVFVLLLPILLGFTGLAVDISRVLQAKQELQNAADAAALAGAAALDDAGGDVPYNWTAAAHDATQWIGKNPVSGRVLTDGTVTVGYVRPGDPLQTVHSPSETGWIGPFDVPAVQVGLALAVGYNGGPLDLLFGAFLGASSKDIKAMATAAAYPPGYAAPGALFPIAIGRCMYDLYWDYAGRKPRLDPATGKPYAIQIGSVYGGGSCFSGEWTTFNTVLNDVPAVQMMTERLLTLSQLRAAWLGQSASSDVTEIIKQAQLDNPLSAISAGLGSAAKMLLLAAGAFVAYKAFVSRRAA